MNRERYICANCGFVFESDVSMNVFCPHCGSNACDIHNNIKKEWTMSKESK